MPGKVIKSYQLRVYMNGREIGLTQVDAAYIAEFSERTAQRIEAGEHQPKRGVSCQLPWLIIFNSPCPVEKYADELSC